MPVLLKDDFFTRISTLYRLWAPYLIIDGSFLGRCDGSGGYALVGAAAFSSGVTHSISICVVISEMTGQIRHIVPVMIAVLVSNAISTLLQPSLYDSIIMIKKLPYLPDILPSSSGAYHIFVEDFMMRNIKYIWNGMSYHELMATIKQSRKVRAFPLVDNPSESPIHFHSFPCYSRIRLHHPRIYHPASGYIGHFERRERQHLRA